MPTAFKGTAGMVSFARDNEVGNDSEHHVDRRGSIIENDLMDLLNGALDVSPFTFLGSSEDKIDPFFDADFANVEKNSYGRPVQRVSPITRQQEIMRSIAYPLTLPSTTSDFTAVMPTAQRIQELKPLSFPQDNSPGEFVHLARPKRHGNLRQFI